VVATTAAGRFSSGGIDAPRLGLDSLVLLHGKWSQVLGQDPEDVMSMARQFVTNGTVDIDRLVG
jgi:hypothetical protein